MKLKDAGDVHEVLTLNVGNTGSFQFEVTHKSCGFGEKHLWRSTIFPFMKGPEHLPAPGF